MCINKSASQVPGPLQTLFLDPSSQCYYSYFKKVETEAWRNAWPETSTYWSGAQVSPSLQLLLLARLCLSRGRGIQERGPSSVRLGMWSHLELHVHQGSPQVLVCGLGACGLEARVDSKQACAYSHGWLHGHCLAVLGERPNFPPPQACPAPLPLPI